MGSNATTHKESKQQQQQSADKKQKNNNNRQFAALTLKRSYSLPIPVSPSPSSPNKKTTTNCIKPTKLKRSNTRRFIDEMNSDKNKPRVMPKIHLIRRFEAHKTRIRSVSVSAIQI